MIDGTIFALDFFAAGVPPGAIFQMDIDSLKEISGSERLSLNANKIYEICLIALVAYFESFCKNEFSSLINICPNILENFCKHRRDVTINIEDYLSLGISLRFKLGFVLSEKYDFGSAKKINSLYNDLISISPFSKKEIISYDHLLNDRNLLVHHGGIVTMKYKKQNKREELSSKSTFFDSLVISKNDFQRWMEFLEEIVIKIVNECHNALSNYISENKILLTSAEKEALEYLGTYDFFD
ncbi:MAG: hypothetical protein U9R01_00945 [candidate division WOR-3 bacterium]|nr:hypothetical protein [candidate division WOR-3 bacterium]